jgi:sugar phosphate isomerase/epimerase
VSICDTIDRLAGRVGCLHLKDYKTYKYDEGATSYKPTIAPVGDGNIDFKSVVRHAIAAGTKHFLVEQDNAAEMPDTLAQVERSIRYLNTNLAEI